jgi:hypothetical protein
MMTCMASRTLEENLALDSAQLAQREQLGDQLDKPREVEHFAYFRRRRAAEEAGTILAAAGFRVDIGRSGLRTRLVARRDSDVLAATVDAATRLMFETVEARGGDYDGWGGTIVPAT